MSGQVSVTVNSYRKLAFRPLVWFSSSQLNTVFIGLRNSQELVVSPFLLALSSWHWEFLVRKGVKAVVRKLDE